MRSLCFKDKRNQVTIFRVTPDTWTQDVEIIVREFMARIKKERKNGKVVLQVLDDNKNKDNKSLGN